MKRIRFGLLLLLVFSVPPTSFAGVGFDKVDGDHKWGVDEIVLGSLNLTEEQREQIQRLRDAFQKESAPIRARIFEKRAELRLMWMQPKPDPTQVRALEGEVHSLLGQFRGRFTDYRLAFRNLLSQEQLATFLALRADLKRRRHRDRK